jgi:hypothetical protein
LDDPDIIISLDEGDQVPLPTPVKKMEKEKEKKPTLKEVTKVSGAPSQVSPVP